MTDQSDQRISQKNIWDATAPPARAKLPPDWRLQRSTYLIRRPLLSMSGIRVEVKLTDLTPVLILQVRNLFAGQELQLYGDAQTSRELLRLSGRKHFESGLAYDVRDVVNKDVPGVIRRDDASSNWVIGDAWGNTLAQVMPEILPGALTHRMLAGAVPPRYDIVASDGRPLAMGTAEHDAFNYSLRLVFADATGERDGLDRRLALSAAVILALIGGQLK